MGLRSGKEPALGPATLRELAAAGISTLREVAATSVESLVSIGVSDVSPLGQCYGCVIRIRITPRLPSFPSLFGLSSSFSGSSICAPRRALGMAAEPRKPFDNLDKLLPRSRR